MEKLTIQELVERGMKKIPASFVQQIEQPVEVDSIPVIDLRSLLDCCEAETEKLARACREWGFFQVVNHGIPDEVLSTILEECRHFFQLPANEKLKLPKGFEGYGRFNTASEDISDWVDILRYYTAPLSKKNVQKWPKHPPQLRQTIENYSGQIQKFNLMLLAVISKTLGLPPDYIQEISGEYTSILRMNYFPPCPEPQQALGISSHSDGGLVTALIQDADALQVRNNGKWVPVRGIPNAVIVNLGDMLQVISNGLYRSVDHRAVVSENSDRVSIAMFCTPASGAVISPAKQLSDPAKYRSCSFAISFYFREKTPGKARVDSLLLDEEC